MRHEYIARREDTLLLIIDLQEAMLKAIPDCEVVLGKTVQLIEAALVLGVPIVVTEQYKKGLGGTHPQVLEKIEAPNIFCKEHFSACLEPGFLPAIDSFHKKQVVVAGTEAHVCVLQTCLDMILAGFQVHLAADAVASRRVENKDTAIFQMQQAGAVISSAEIVIFEWAERANTDEFRKVLPIVR
jgi:nicotinamidase-related amidase